MPCAAKLDAKSNDMSIAGKINTTMPWASLSRGQALLKGCCRDNDIDEASTGGLTWRKKRISSQRS